MQPLRIVLVIGLLTATSIAIWNCGQRPRETSNVPPWCGNSLKAVSLALHNYHEDHGCFPPVVVRGEDGKPMHCWRALILPYLEAPSYSAYDFKQRWDSPPNLAFAQEIFGRDSSWYQGCFCQKLNLPTETVVFAVTGPNTAWPQDRCISLDDVNDIQDATIQLVAVSHSGINWFEPRDFSVDEIPTTSEHGEGILVGMISGVVKFLPSTEFSKAFFTIDAADHVSQDALKRVSDYRD